MHIKKNYVIVLFLLLGSISIVFAGNLKNVNSKDKLSNVSLSDSDSLTITNPIGSASWQVGTSQSVTWTSTGDIDTITLELHKNNNWIEDIAVYTSNDGSFIWSIPYDLANGVD